MSSIHRESQAGLFYDRGGAVVNVKHPDFGAIGDARHVIDGAIVAGTSTLTSATAAFSARDVGKTIMVAKAGVSGTNLRTAILAYTNATTVSLSAKASSTVRGKVVVWGTIDTSAVTAALKEGVDKIAAVHFPDGGYLIDDELVLVDNQTVNLSAGVAIYQIAPNKGGFKVVQQDQVWIHCNGAVIFGEGSWLPSWSDFASHQERGVQFLRCTNSGITYPRFRNWAMASFAVLGGSNILIDHPECEGTHALGTPLATRTSIYQFAGVVMHDTKYGAFKNVRVVSPTCFNSAIGINSVMNVVGDGQLTISDFLGHTYFAQHALYLGTSNTQVANPTISGCGLDGIKLYSGVGNEVLENVNVADFAVSNCGGQAVQLGVSGSGSISASSVTGTAINCARCLVIDGNIRGLKARITSERMRQYDLYLAGSVGPSDCDIELTGRNATLDSVLVSSASSSRNRIRAKIYRPSRGGGSFRGIYINACASLTIDSPELIDDDAKMSFGIFADAKANRVTISGFPKILGYTNNGVRMDGIGCEWQASPGEFTSFATAFYDEGQRLLPVSELVIQRQSATNTDVTLWNLTMEEGSAYLVTARLVGKHRRSAQQGGFVSSAVFSRHESGAVTLEGVGNETVNIRSPRFLGAYSWSPAKNDIRLLVNSGETAPVDWIVRITVTRLIDDRR
jgi:hypothetical protein